MRVDRLDFLSRCRAHSGSTSTTSFEGLTEPALSGYNYASHQGTLVLAIRKGCHYCDESMPFYKRLADLEKEQKLHAHLLAVMPDDQISSAGIFSSAGIKVDGVFGQQLESLNVSGTPTLLLLDTRGRVERAWVGELSSQGEQEVVAAAQR